MKLSMVTVCYNAENCIGKTIRSVLSQTTPVYEYIIIDGGSKDRTVEICESYRSKFAEQGIEFNVISEKDKGISDAFNKGISRAAGDLIGLINADDEMLEETCEILQHAFTEGVDVYYGNCIWEEKENKLRFVSKPKEQTHHGLSKLLYEMVMIHPATFISQKAYQQYGMYDISFRYCMDQELLYRMYQSGASFQYINRELTIFVAGGISDTNPQKVFRETSRIPLMYHEPLIKVRAIEYKKLIRDFFARKAKRFGVYHIIKKQM